MKTVNCLYNYRFQLFSLLLIVTVVTFVYNFLYFDKQLNWVLRSIGLVENYELNIMTKEIYKIHKFPKGYLAINRQRYMIYTYDDADLISASIREHGVWEGKWLKELENILKLNPGTVFLDIGANLGIYTLVAAVMGSNVIAVDGNEENLIRLRQTIHHHKLNDKVILVNNVVYSTRKKFRMSFIPANIGGQNAVQDDKGKVNSILMDDLLPLLKLISGENRTKIIIKLDIEGSEIHALRNASKIFDEFDVLFVQMEWEHNKTKPDIQALINFLLYRKFLPVKSYFDKEHLQLENSLKWPYDIVWRKFPD